MNVGIVHEAVDANAGDEEAGKGEADLKGKGRRIGEPVLLGLGTSHGRSLIRARENKGTRRGEYRHTFNKYSKLQSVLFLSVWGQLIKTYRERGETRHLVAVDLNSGL